MNKANQAILHLAPMCNITNKATRKIARQLGCDVTWSEMISSEGLVRQKPTDNKSLALAKKFNNQESPYWVQIFGNNPKNMAKAAKIIETEIQPTGIDINLGCPVPKAQKNNYGAVQMKNIPQVIEIIQAMKKEISLPLSLKTRLGVENEEKILDFAPHLVKAGLDQLVVHARTLKGLFSEEPKWKIVKKLNNILPIPVVYNGGIKTPEDAKFYLEKTGCTNLMIGQGAIGNPWIFQEIQSFLKTGRSSETSLVEKKKLLLKHAELVIGYYGSEKGLIGFRAQLSAYLRNLKAPKKIRQQAVQIATWADLKNLLQDFN